MITTIPFIAMQIATSQLPSQDVVLPPFQYNGVVFTHWVLESSDDMVHWRNRYDWTTNSDGSIRVTNSYRNEFFRIAGDTI